ncbi:p53-like transcription factor [Wallemia mellicola]|uniref:p53-like transcription factor n=1 Tax=Wallemia mellicola TaxID=1708541 RepID=A0A4T0NGE8_9BASI|nr:p53-like transcription factor [Wallemia mellicola]TIC09818.1 p53-like transcription factor [Wallemia mellicola]TIC28282.1 p53-like transcription factor [Wallemia mellicola]
MIGEIAQEEENLSNPLVAVSGHLIPILSFQVALNASMYDEDAVVEDSVNLVQFSSAREKGPKVKPQRESITALINSTSDDVEAQAVKFERIQFERSTNRKMEKFRLNVTLYAQLENGVDVQVATVKSLPISVRGRSPAHYTDDMYTGRGLPRVKSSQTLRNKMANTMRVSKSTPSLSNTKAREKMSTMTVSGSSKPTLEDLATACEIDMATL